MGKRRMIIEDVTYQNKSIGKIGPILPSFQHAPCNPDSLVTSCQGVEISVDWSGGPKPAIDVKLSTESMTYKNVVADNNADKFYTTFVAIRNKETGKTRLIEANEIVLKPDVEYPKSTNPVLLQDGEEKKTLEEKIEASKHLIKSFGQSKGIRFYDQQDRMKVDSTQVEDKVMKAAGVVTEDQIQAAPQVQEVEIIPKRNEAATRSDQVYKIEDQLTPSEIKNLTVAGDNALLDWKTVEDLRGAEKQKLLSPLGVEIFTKFINTAGELGMKPGIALYMEGIIKFTKLRLGDMKKGEKSLPTYLPLAVKKKIFSVFSQTSGGNNRVVTPELKDRAVCHVMVLSLMLSNWKLDASLLSESIRVRPDHLKKLVSMVGAHLVSDSVTQSQFIVLKLPLATFQVTYMGGKKKSRN